MAPVSRSEPDELKSLIDSLTNRISNLEKFIDKNDADTRDALGTVKMSVAKIQTFIYGSPDYRLKGIGERLENVEKCVREIASARRSERDKLKGIQIVLGATGITGITTLITIVAQIFTK